MPVSVKSYSEKAPEKGTVLLVIIAVVALAGVIMLLGVGSFSTRDTADQILTTSRKQNFLISQLAAYAQRENVLPCPADPAIPPDNANFGVAQANCNEATSEGIIPFRTLHLSKYDVLDGWGHLMTYRISPVLANISATGGGDRIFARCRRFAWFDDSPGADPFNVYLQKARFCCPPIDGGFNADTDLRIFSSTADIAGGNVVGGLGRLADPAFYGLINDPYNSGGPQGALAPLPAAAGNEEFFAVAIISHGQNGTGAYMDNGTGGRLAGAASADEQENIDGDRDIVTRPINVVSSANDFDDIVIWRSQISLIGQLNNGSCYMPWR